MQFHVTLKINLDAKQVYFVRPMMSTKPAFLQVYVRVQDCEIRNLQPAPRESGIIVCR